MLYRIRANQTTEWVSHFDKKIFGLFAEHGGTVDDLEWKPSERIVDGDTIRLALRYGVRSQIGLVVDSGDLEPLDHRDQMMKSHAEGLARRPEHRKLAENIEPIMPGRLVHQDHLDSEVDASVRETIGRAQAKFLRAVETPVDATLVQHWQSLGGRIPEPL
jgi:hypothetical protein